MAPEKKSLTPKRGELYLVNFDPTVGSEIKKTRPALILQNDVANRHSSVTIVAAVSSQFTEPLYPTEVLIEPADGVLERTSVVLLNQVRTIDKTRLIKKIGVIPMETMEQVNRALEISLGLLEL